MSLSVTVPCSDEKCRKSADYEESSDEESRKSISNDKCIYDHEGSFDKDDHLECVQHEHGIQHQHNNCWDFDSVGITKVDGMFKCLKHIYEYCRTWENFNLQDI